jgi:hypothetical protein
MKFSGKKFVMTTYPFKRPGGDWSYTNSFHSKGSDGYRWVLDNMDKFILIKDIGGTAGIAYRNDMNGTYSISDNKIELLFSDGKINVCSFSRTENIITIDGTQLTRAR